MDRWSEMQTFAAVVETGSFSAAARRLRIGQPAVSKGVRQLEERLGTALLTRSPRSLRATTAGQSFYEHARVALAEADEAETSARGAGLGLAGRLRISAAVTFARLKIVPKLGSFLAAHPRLDIELILDDRNIDLIGEGVDVAIRIGDLTDSALTARRIGRMRRRVVGSPEFFTRAGAPQTPRDLEQREAIVYTPSGGGASWTFSRADVVESVTLRGRIRTTAAEGMREAVLAGLGLAVASDAMLGDEIRRGLVWEVLADWRLPSLDIWAMFPSGRRPTAKAQAFAAFAESALRDEG